MKILSTLIFVALSILSYAQCTINYSPTTPGTYPAILPDGMVGMPYNEDLTILFPTNTSGTNYTSFQIVSVELPLGLTWECSNTANDCIYNPQQDPFACIHIFGTPAEPGQITVNISSGAKLTGNTETTYTVSSDLEIYPSSKNNTAFKLTPSMGCESANVDFSLINPINYTPISGQTGGITYTWEFGNAQMSNIENPPTQTYNSSGDYPVKLTEVYDTLGFYLKNVKITTVGCDDPPGWGNPDIYIQVIDGSGTIVHTTKSSPNDANLPQTYTMNIQLNNPPYTIRIMDDDSGNVWGTADDNCINGDENGATTPLSLPGVNQYGTTTQSATNQSLSFTYDIHKDTSQVITVDTIRVYTNPSAPIITMDMNDPISISTPDLGYVYQWNKDNSPLYNANDTLIYISEKGSYTVIAVDNHGCYSAVSNAENYDPLGLEEEIKNYFKLYPNPANGYVNIEFSETMKNAKLLISDLMGRVVHTQSLNGKDAIQMDVSALSAGVYMVTVSNENGSVSTQQLVVGD